jgi:hypothetical protein
MPITHLPRLTARFMRALSTVVLSSALAAQLSPSGVSGVSYQNLSRAVANWKLANKSSVQIDPAATSEIASDIASRSDIKGQPIDVNAWPKPADKRVDLLVSSYISELRDRKYEQTGLPRGSQIKLGAADVQAFSFATYVQDLHLQAILRDPGFLSVTSLPPGAAIKIDNGARGLTDKDFVVSKGKHSVLVKSDKFTCTDGVDVEDDPVVYKCPK